MFEAYTDKAKDAVLFGRIEAVRGRSKFVEIEHLLLGLLRADAPLALRLFGSRDGVDSIRDKLSQQAPGENQEDSIVGSSIDHPISRSCARVVAFAALEADRLQHRNIGPEHLYLGVLSDEKSPAAQLLLEAGLTPDKLEQAVPLLPNRPGMVKGLPQIPRVRDLVAEIAHTPQTTPLVGRHRELDQIIQILSRRSRNSPLLLGDAGVGKETLVHALAQRIAEGDVPQHLLERHILRVDAPDLAMALTPGAPPVASGEASLLQTLFDISQKGGPILYVRGLFDVRDRVSLLANYLKSGKLQMIASGAPLSYRLSLEREEELARCFEVVPVLPPSEAQAVEVIRAGKSEFEKFHSVVISEEAIHIAVSASGHFARHRALPDRAIDLIDDAATLVKLRCEAGPPQLSAIQRRLHSLRRRADQAFVIAKHEIARELIEQEKREREHFDKLKSELDATPRSNTVTAEDVIAAIAQREFVSVESVRAAVERGALTAVEAEVRAELATGIPVGRRDWINGLTSYLADCSAQDADRLLDTIRSAKAKFDKSA